MFSGSARKFLFKCEECLMILSVEFEEKDDLEKVENDDMFLECPCGGVCKVLRN
jgi:hypothetical protein